MTDQSHPDRFARWGMLASALSGHTLRVAPAGPGERAWTDGVTIFLDPGTTARHQLAALAVQASLLAAGSLKPQVLRTLTRRPAVTRRYLAVEGHRALAANNHLLPTSVRPLVDGGIAAATESPEGSLAVALGRGPVADPPECFGTIRCRILLATNHRGSRRRRWIELDEDDTDNPAAASDGFTSSIGGGAVGRLLASMLRAVRRLGAGGQPGANAPTHHTRSAPRGNAAVSWTGPMGPIDGPAGESLGTTYPEWDIHRQRYRPNWCTVREVQPGVGDASLPDGAGEYGLRRPLARLGLGPDWFHRQVHGDDIDIDAAIEARVGSLAGSGSSEAVYIDSLRRRRDLAVLLLLDVSGSVAEPSVAGNTVHEQQRITAAALAVALHGIGDRLALYAFHSQGRSAVRLMPVKRFDDALDGLVLRQLRGLVPGGYSRLGAAIRHGAAVLENRGGTSRRLLVVVSDGLAYDHGYERGYGAADVHRALAEARGRGMGCVCLTVGAGTDPGELQRVFGSASHATVARPEQLSRVVGPLFREALRAGNVRRPGAAAYLEPNICSALRCAQLGVKER
ncbi:nitric oxide reductase activation protein NorD [Mycobacterium decipiens]|uniref:nitric oxide reductase activation protein NorD n=1 Tax=Mycobacterium decipiens TaxID=1430326 RepID=UPI0031018809